VVFPVIVGVIMGWSLRIGAGYFFGITLGYGYPGFVFGSLIDEWLRGIIMMFRWKSNKWQKKRLV
jgi:Na+-driven multidrug efflux pump